jgi:hypothetical protein
MIGADRRMPHPDAPIHAIAETLIIGAEDLPAEIRKAAPAATTRLRPSWPVWDRPGACQARASYKFQHGKRIPEAPWALN